LRGKAGAQALIYLAHVVEVENLLNAEPVNGHAAVWLPVGKAKLYQPVERVARHQPRNSVFGSDVPFPQPRTRRNFVIRDLVA
jgi:hypothetical protein